MVWHPKMDEYMDSLDGYLDEISERLHSVVNHTLLLTEFLNTSETEEGVGEFRNVEESLERVLRFIVTLSLFSKKH